MGAGFCNCRSSGGFCVNRYRSAWSRHVRASGATEWQWRGQQRAVEVRPQYSALQASVSTAQLLISISAALCTTSAASCPTSTSPGFASTTTSRNPLTQSISTSHKRSQAPFYHYKNARLCAHTRKSADTRCYRCDGGYW